MGHIVAARRIWLFRLGYLQEHPAGVFPNGMSISSLKVDADEIHRLWAAYLANLQDIDLERAVNFQTLDGKPFRRTVEDILTQLYGRSMYHRGQISSWMRDAGGEPAPTYYLLWCSDPGPDIS